MCYYIKIYRERTCGLREETARERCACNRPTCRLSIMHREDYHDCDRECTGAEREDAHLIMARSPDECKACQKAGRAKHPAPANDPSIIFQYFGC